MQTVADVPQENNFLHQQAEMARLHKYKTQWCRIIKGIKDRTAKALRRKDLYH